MGPTRQQTRAGIQQDQGWAWIGRNLHYNEIPMGSAHTTTVQSSLSRPDRSPEPSRDRSPHPSTYPDIHDTAARQDGIVKILTGLIIGVFSCGLAAAGVVGLHALLRNQEFKLWAFVVGLPGVIMALCGIALIVWGAAKLVSGRGRG